MRNFSTLLPIIIFFTIQAFISEANGCSIETNLATKQKNKKKATTQQCRGIAKSTKVRCRKSTSNSSGYCSTHGG
jgi:hypothetical protein